MANGSGTGMDATYDQSTQNVRHHSLLGHALFLSREHYPPWQYLPADFPIICLPGDKLFQSKEVAEGFSLPPVVHAFHGNKAALGRKLEKWHDVGLQPLAVALLAKKHPRCGHIPWVVTLSEEHE